MRILVTRPQPDATRTAERLAALGHDVVVEPLFTLEVIEIKKIPEGPFEALAATSANAMRAVRGMSALDPLRKLPLHAVGMHTADAAREAGFADVVDAGGDAESLAENIVRHVRSPGRVLHLAGVERAKELGPLVAPRGIEVMVLELYRMRAADTLGASAQRIASGAVDAVLHFSPRSAATFVVLAERAGVTEAARRLRHLCLSAAVAAELMPLRTSGEVAAEPNEPALLALLNL
jgi:uroporphyrinogen-III synthase